MSMAQSLEPVNVLLYMVKKDLQIWLRILKWEDYLRAQSNHKSPYKREKVKKIYESRNKGWVDGLWRCKKESCASGLEWLEKTRKQSLQKERSPVKTLWTPNLHTERVKSVGLIYLAHVIGYWSNRKQMC
jgi:hypothetical protein